MTEIEQVSDWALTIAAEAAGSKLHHYERMADDNRLAQSIEAHARAIEQHEAFRQEVSDAVVKATHTMAAGKLVEASGILAALIIAKPDPLVEALRQAIEVTQADREAAKEAEHFLDGCGCDVCLQKAAEVFARHRLAEREAVVKWLREQDGHGYDDIRANCIEAGEPFK